MSFLRSSFASDTALAGGAGRAGGAMRGACVVLACQKTVSMGGERRSGTSWEEVSQYLKVHTLVTSIPFLWGKLILNHTDIFSQKA